MVHTDIDRFTILDRLPEILPIEEDSVISRYVEAGTEEFEVVDERVDDVITAHQVDQASGRELDRIGAMFGQLGRRGGRTDDEYRSYLRSIVRSFNGRGSRSGLKFAIASAVRGDPEDIEIEEDFQNLEYTIVIEDVDASFLSATINELAELADPSGVDLDEAIIVTEGTEILIIGGDSTIIAQSVGLGGDILTLDGQSTLG